MMHSVQVSYLCYTVWVRLDNAEKLGLKHRQPVDAAMFMQVIDRNNCVFSDNGKISVVPEWLH